MTMLMAGEIKEMTVPEQVPQWFDSSFDPKDTSLVNLGLPEYGSPPRYRPEIPFGQSYTEMVAKHGVPVARHIPKTAGSLERVLEDLQNTIWEREGQSPP
jgi:hypothetical protein